MQVSYDILGIGSATVDEFLVVDRFPSEDSKQAVVSVDRQGGGLVSTVLVAAARLGVRCAYADVMGVDEDSRWIEADMQREGIDTSLVAHHADARPIHAFIIVAQDQSTRTILYTTAGQQPYAPDYPPTAAIRAAKVLLIDDVNQLSIPQLVRAVRIAREAGIPVVADFELQPHADLLHAVNHLIVSQRYAEKVTGLRDPLAAARALWHDDRAAVVVTCGVEGSWALTSDGEPIHQPAYPVQAVDTTGCGDVFHGAYAAALTWGYDLRERLRWAAASAALKARALGGRRGIAGRDEVGAWMLNEA
jgi:ribokinase